MYDLLGSDYIWPEYNFLKIWNLRVQKILNIEKIVFLSCPNEVHITNQ